MPVGGGNVATGSRSSEQFFVVGMVIGSAIGLALGSALGLQIRPDRIRAARRLLRRVLGQGEDRVRFDLLV